MPVWIAWLACVNGEAPDAAPLTVVTFNTGTTEGLPHDAEDDGYTSQHAATSDTWYGDGLAWLPAVDAARAFLADTQPDIVAFQEIFDPSGCPDIPEDAWPGFVCETWQAGDPTVAEDILGDAYEVSCFPGKPDKCLAVRSELGLLGPLEGEAVEGCGSGARVARGTLGGRTLVGVHGSSGFASEDIDCRVAQVEQVFADLPADVLILGDLNTDPGRQGDSDDSAAAWNTHVVDPLHFISEVGPDAPRSYGGLADIDHVISDTLDGSCRYVGLDSPPVYAGTYFDHVPVVCEVE